MLGIDSRLCFYLGSRVSLILTGYHSPEATILHFITHPAKVTVNNNGKLECTLGSLSWMIWAFLRPLGGEMAFCVKLMNCILLQSVGILAAVGNVLAGWLVGAAGWALGTRGAGSRRRGGTKARGRWEWTQGHGRSRGFPALWLSGDQSPGFLCWGTLLGDTGSGCLCVIPVPAVQLAEFDCQSLGNGDTGKFPLHLPCPWLL